MSVVPLSLTWLEESEKQAKREYYESVKDSPLLVCIKKDGWAWIGFVGPEPATYPEWRKDLGNLGNAGRGYFLVDLFEERTVTHNLNSDQYVEPEFADIFHATHETFGILGTREDRAYWGAKAEGEA